MVDEPLGVFVLPGVVENVLGVAKLPGVVVLPGAMDEDLLGGTLNLLKPMQVTTSLQ